MNKSKYNFGCNTKWSGLKLDIAFAMWQWLFFVV